MRPPMGGPPTRPTMWPASRLSTPSDIIISAPLLCNISSTGSLCCWQVAAAWYSLNVSSKWWQPVFSYCCCYFCSSQRCRRTGSRMKGILISWFLADRTYGGAYAIQCCVRPSVVVCRLSPSVTLCIVAKRCVLEQKLLLRAYRKSYMRNRLVPKWMTLTFV